MPKLAGDFSTHDLICHVNPDHLNPPGEKQGYDLADLLFGAINGERQADALRGRVSIETALAVGKPTPQPQLPTILNSPKPSYFPNYITQQAHPATWKLKSGQQYATYISTTGSRAPTLRGFKRYPVRAEGVEVQALTGGQQNNTRVQVRLHPLPANTRFRGRITFHNLKPAELGALLWALTWGANTTLRHSLGMGKPFGFGQVGIDIDLQRSRLIPNDPAQPEAPLSAETQAQFIQQFCAQMRAAIPGWETSAQLRNLLAMADPAAAQKWKEGGRELRHMRLDAASTAKGAASSGNQFVQAKQNGLVLADYGVATGTIAPQDYRPLSGKPCRTPGSAQTPQAAAAAGAPHAPRPPEPTIQESQEQWTGVRLSWNKGNGTLTAACTAGKAEASGTKAQALLDTLPDPQRKKLRDKGELSGAQVTVQIKGNQRLITALIWPGTA
jgi:hypothetical protein